MLSFRYEEEKELSGSISLADLPVSFDLAKRIALYAHCTITVGVKNAQCVEKQENNIK